MRIFALASGVMLALVSCQPQEKDTFAVRAKEPGAIAAKEEPTASGSQTSKPTKASERRTITEKRAPVAEPVPDKPGYVKSPYTGELVDVSDESPGAQVADPTVPPEELKHFRVPEPDGSEKFGTLEYTITTFEDGKEVSTEKVPVAQAVPGKPGFIFSPYDNSIIDATGAEPGSLFKDPGSPEDDPRFIHLPGETWREFQR